MAALNNSKPPFLDKTTSVYSADVPEALAFVRSSA